MKPAGRGNRHASQGELALDGPDIREPEGLDLRDKRRRAENRRRGRKQRAGSFVEMVGMKMRNDHCINAGDNLLRRHRQIHKR